MREVGRLLAHPLVLRAAWMRVEEWYRSGNLAPQPELARWQLHPERELRKLGAEISRGEWRPSSWPQIPYPKKGRRLRHYVLPSVKDQVAFMAHLILLAPFIDSRTESFSFGHRWYRPIMWIRRQRPEHWDLLPYPLMHRRTYLPYARTHGLFRRVAHWTAAKMTGVGVQAEDYRGVLSTPEDYEDDTLPPWVFNDWWGGASEKGRVHWAKLDLRLAYPSVMLERLEKELETILREYPWAEIQYGKLISGYPGDVLEQIKSEGIMLDVGRSLISGLKAVHILDDEIPRSTWHPDDSDPLPELPPGKDPGLPTGLAVSGILLNAALRSADADVLDHLKKQSAKNRGAILRFADDMTLLSVSPKGLFHLIEEVWRAISRNPHARINHDHSPSNLFLNYAKVEPAPIKKFLYRFRERKEETAEPDSMPRDRKQLPAEADTLVDAWMALQDHGESAALLDDIDRSAANEDDLGPFLTALVSRLSEIGRDTLGERFGEAARDRLAQLHELARFDIDDDQVRPDTRRAFACNGLVRAWLPDEREPAKKGLEDIRSSVQHALSVTPWKFSLWRAVVRAAARRPPASTDEQRSQDRERAREFLIAQLRRVSHVGFDHDDPRCWMVRWPLGRDHSSSVRL